MMKRITKILLLLIIFLVNTNKCYAWGGMSVGTVNVNDGSSSSGDSNPKDPDGYYGTTWGGKDNDGNDVTYTCKYKYKVNVSDDVKVYGFNQDGTEIMENKNGSIGPTESLLAGTSIGINITETKTVSYVLEDWKITGTRTVAGETKYYCCRYYCCRKIPCGSNLTQTIIGYRLPLLVIVPPKEMCEECAWGPVQKKSCTSECKTYDNKQNSKQYNCTDNSTEEQTLAVKPSEIPAAESQKCESAAKTAAEAAAKSQMYPSYVVKLHDPNNIDGGIIQDVGANACGFPSGATSATCNYHYGVSNVCLDSKTAKVSYRSGECLTGEISIPNKTSGGITYWHYFIPLNMTSDKQFEISMAHRSQGGVQPANFCKKVIETYPSNYTTFIKDANGNNLTGDSSVDNATVSTGCQVASSILIDVNQKFYGEKTIKGEKKLSGYAFYYRPIDITNPFPNGVGSKSYWEDWYELANNKKNPNLLNSFNKISYKIDNINASAVRAYKNNNPYSSWRNMNLNGSSSFVSTYNMRQGTQTYYKLGCGPANASWEGCG